VPTVVLPSGPVLAYDDTGSGPEGSSVVVLSHGLLMDRTMFGPQVEALRAEHRCLTWDGRGHGETTHDGKPFTFWDSADDLVGLLDALEVDRAVLVGMSQGGFLSLRAALAHPDRVEAVVLLDSQAGLEDPAAAPLYRQLAADWQANGPDGAALAFVAALILGDGVDHAPWIHRWTEQPPERATQVLDPLLTRDDLTDRLDEIACPVLVVHGTADAAIPVERARAVAEGVRDCRGLVLVEGGSHATNLSHPDEVNEALAEFLSDL
jgi:pimeloyl-ACP methyl ester carboxylesterase